MNRVYIRLYGNLINLSKIKEKNFTFEFTVSTSVKDIVESLGIPHTEVSLVLVDDKSVGWNFNPSNNSRISYYPFFYAIDISKISKVYYKVEKLKFICDVHLGRLSKYLRMLGFDCYYKNDLSDEDIIQLSLREKRIILTMDRGILKNKKVTYGLLIRSKDIFEQTKEAVDRFNLYSKIKPLTRCLECNKKLKKISRKTASKTFPYLKDKYYKEFYLCPACNKIYYKGSHYERMKKILKDFCNSYFP